MHLVDLTMFYAAEGGGVSTYLDAKSRWLARQARTRHTILSPNVGRGAAPAQQRLPSVHLPGMHGYRMPLSVAAIARRLQRLRPDLIEAGDAGHCAWAALRARDRLAVPAVAFYHSDLPRLVANRFGGHAAGIARHYLSQLYGQFDLVLAPSRLMVDQLQAMGVGGALHQPLGIDCATFHPGRRDPGLRARLGVAPGARLLVYAGRFTADKKLDVLLRAVAGLGPGHHLLLVGGGAQGAALPAGLKARVASDPAVDPGAGPAVDPGADPDVDQAVGPGSTRPHATLGATPVSRLPFQRDPGALARILASCDLLVHPGDCETFGLIVLEAMGCGLPVVATRAGGVAELVDPQTGVLAQPNCAASLAEAIGQACSGDLGLMGAHARRKVEACFEWDQVFAQLMARYGRLLARAAPAGMARDPVCATK